MVLYRSEVIEVVILLIGRKKIHAIKFVREATGCSLRVALDVVNYVIKEISDEDDSLSFGRFLTPILMGGVKIDDAIHGLQQEINEVAFPQSIEGNNAANRVARIRALTNLDDKVDAFREISKIVREV